MNTTPEEEREQTMAQASVALAKLADSMIRDLPQPAQTQLTALIGTGATLAIHTLLIPSPHFILLLLPPDEDGEPIELAWCAPSAETVRLMGMRSPVSH